MISEIPKLKLSYGWADRNRNWMLLPIVVIFCTSLAFDGFYLGSMKNPTSAWESLVFGWIATFEGHFSWIANPLFIIASVQLLRRSFRHALISSVLCLALALSFQMYESIVMDTSGSPTSIVGYGLGYYLWILSIVLLVLACAIGNIQFHRAKNV